jgi:alpha-1,3-glucan synthase
VPRGEPFSFLSASILPNRPSGCNAFTMAIVLFSWLLVGTVRGLRYDPAFADYNLNQNQRAANPLDYDGDRGSSFKYHDSPEDWRIPTYTLFLDRFANGDPSNDDANATVFEQDITSNQLRHGGDLKGLVDSLDYIQGMGMKVW